MYPESLLTVERPHLWRAAVGLAEGLTGYTFPPKRPAADGTIYACGDLGQGRLIETDRRKKSRLTAELEWLRRQLELNPDPIHGYQDRIDKTESELKKIEEPKKTAEVPDGAMEWLLHEVGHWVAATPAERLLPNYGVGPSETGSDGVRELQAWAFEEIVLAPFGHARDFAPPSQRDGAAFAKTGPLPGHAMRHVERQIAALGLDVEQWRAVYGEWIRWGIGKGPRAPWISVN